MLDETLETAADDLAEARDKIEATRAALLAALDGREDAPEVRQAVARLERLASEVARVEAVVEGRVGAGVRTTGTRAVL